MQTCAVLVGSMKEVEMKAIEAETVLAPDGKLPEEFQEVFGRKVRVIVLFDEVCTEAAGQSASLMKLAGKITAFRDVADPVAWQQRVRSEWD